MTRALRGARERRGTLLPLGLVSALVVAGTVAARALVAEEGLGLALTAPLLLLGLVALAGCGHELAASRLPEVGLVRLRGLHGVWLAGWLVLEPLVVLLLGAVVGLAAAVAGLRAGEHHVGAGDLVGAVATAGAVVLLGSVVVLLELLSGGAESLDASRGAATPADRGSRVGTAALVLLLTGAAVAAYRSGEGDPQDPGWLVLVGPALFGLVAGQVTIWALRLVGRVALWHQMTERGGSAAGLVTARRLAGLEESGSGAAGVRLLVAGAVVATLAATGLGSVSSWTDETARLRAGAPQGIEVEGGSLQALAVTREADPEGRWLMAAEEISDEASGTAQVLLDTARYEQVVGDFYGGTRAESLGEGMGALAPGADTPTVQLVTGTTLAATLKGPEPERSAPGHPAPLRVTVSYVNDENYAEEATLRLGAGEVSAQSRLSRCSGGCAMSSMTLTGEPGASYQLSRLDFGGLDLTGVPWSGGLTSAATGLRWDAGRAGRAEVTVRSGPLPVIGAGHDTAPGTEATLTDANGGQRPVLVTGQVDALPLVEGDGMLADLPRFLTVAAPSGVSDRSLVLAREDTPQGVLDKVGEVVGAQFHTLDDVRATTADDIRAERAVTYFVIGVLALLTAVPLVLAGAARGRASVRHDVAALRLLGLPTRQVRTGRRVEAALLALTAAVVTLVGGAFTVAVLLDDLTLIDLPAGSVPLQTGPALLPLVGAALAVSVLAFLARLSPGRHTSVSTQPMSLVREGNRWST